MFLSYISNFYHYVLENGCKGSDFIDMKTKRVKIMSKCQLSMLGMTFFLAIFINKKYPAGRLPDILWCKLHFERNAFVAF